MNILHMKYACEVAKAGSLSKASEVLLVAVPNISRSIRELEADLGITIFERTTKGMILTAQGAEFMGYAKGILRQIERVEKLYREGLPARLNFSVSVPRACYISEAFARFSGMLTEDAADIYYMETSSQHTVDSLLKGEYKLGIIRYAEDYDRYFRAMLEEKGLDCELITEFSYCLMMSADSPLAGLEEIKYEDLSNYIEIAHADHFVPVMPFPEDAKSERPDNIPRRIFVYERASQYDLLSQNPLTFMWVSPATADVLKRYNLVQRQCGENTKVYKDVLIYKKGYTFTELDEKFVAALSDSTREYVQAE